MAGPTTEAAGRTLKMYDNDVGDTTTYATLECDDMAGTPFVIGSIYKFHKITFNMGTAINDSHTIGWEYSSDDTGRN